MESLWTRACRAWWLAPLCFALVVLLDAALKYSQTMTTTGLLDEPAHFATTLICLLALAGMLALAGRGRWPLPLPFVLAALVMGNLIDLDHLPMALGNDALTAGTPRPYSHSLITVVLLAAGAGAARLGRRRLLGTVLAGAAFGVCCHLFRDLGTAPVALLWPVSSRGLVVPESAYLVVLAGLVLAAVAGRSAAHRTPDQTPGPSAVLGSRGDVLRVP
jgi:inner membrane protein